MQTLPIVTSSASNAMDVAQKYLPSRIELDAPVGQDKLLNDLFPQSMAKFEICQCEAGKAAEINRYLDVLADLFEEHRRTLKFRAIT